MQTTAIVIDDDEDTVEVFSEYLSIKNIKVLGRGKNGQEAFRLYQKLKPDIVFMDVMMPDFDGVYGLAKIRDFDENAKIILVTASISNTTQQQLLQLSASAIVWKPYNMTNLLEIIDRVIKGETHIFPRGN